MKDSEKKGKIRELDKKASVYFDKGSNAKTDRISKENFLKSANYFKKILRLQPNDIDALAMSGGALSNARRYKEALKFLNKAIKLNPKEVLVLENKGITLNQQRRYKEALKYFNKVLKIEPQREHTKINKWYTLEELERYDNEFYKLLDLVIRKDSDDFTALSHKAMYLIKRKKPKKAIMYYKEALKAHDKVCELKKCENRDEIFINIGKLLTKIKLTKLDIKRERVFRKSSQSKCIKDKNQIRGKNQEILFHFVKNKGGKVSYKLYCYLDWSYFTYIFIQFFKPKHL